MTDLLTIEPHTPTPEPVKYNKEDGQWYTHDGVDVKDTQQRKGEFKDSLRRQPSIFCTKQRSQQAPAAAKHSWACRLLCDI